MAPADGQSPRESAASGARPREVTGLIAPALRVTLVWPYRVVLWVLLRAGLKPDHLTMASLATSGAAAVLLGRGMRGLPGGLLALSGILDVFDGAVARARGLQSVRGAWFDSVIDRLSDALVLGALFLSLAWEGQRADSVLALCALAVSLLVSHIRAEAEARGISLREGVFARPERVIALIVGLWVPHALTPALAALVVLGGLTLAQRAWIAVRAFGR